MDDVCTTEVLYDFHVISCVFNQNVCKRQIVHEYIIIFEYIIVSIYTTYNSVNICQHQGRRTSDLVTSKIQLPLPAAKVLSIQNQSKHIIQYGTYMIIYNNVVTRDSRLWGNLQTTGRKRSCEPISSQHGWAVCRPTVLISCQNTWYNPLSSFQFW